jgi:hypothetical protein
MDVIHQGTPPTVSHSGRAAEIWNQNSPTGSYWNQTRILSDNRIPALESAGSSYIFQAAKPEAVQVKVELVYRRAFIELQEIKGWSDFDLLLAEKSIEIQ